MEKERCIDRIKKASIIAVIRAENSRDAFLTAEAVRKGGIDVIEITFTVPNALKVIEELRQAYGANEILIGAGTVLDSETARAALLSGADFVISPCFNNELLRLCNRYQILCIPGAMTVTEIVTAMDAGADIVKVFPGNVLGPGFIKAVKGPLPHARLIPTGGVDLNNLDLWIRSGSMGVGVGGKLTKGAETGDYALVEATAKKFVNKIAEVKASL